MNSKVFKVTRFTYNQILSANSNGAGRFERNHTIDSCGGIIHADFNLWSKYRKFGD